MSPSEGRSSTKAKFVDNEFLDGGRWDGVEPVDPELSDGLVGADPIMPSVIWYHTSKY